MRTIYMFFYYSEKYLNSKRNLMFHSTVQQICDNCNWYTYIIENVNKNI